MRQSLQNRQWVAAFFERPAREADSIDGVTLFPDMLATATLAERLKRIEEQIEQMLSEVEAAEAATEALAGEVRGGKRTTQLSVELADSKARPEKLTTALEIAQTLDESRSQHDVDIAKNPAQVPMTDSDSPVMPHILRTAKSEAFEVATFRQNVGFLSVPPAL